MGRNSKDNSLARYEELLKISVRYNDYIRHPRFRITFSSRSRRQLNDAVKYVKNVKDALGGLSKEDRHLISNEFFSNRNNQLWWTKYYSQSTYYRKRYFAIKAFIERFEQ